MPRNDGLPTLLAVTVEDGHTIRVTWANGAQEVVDLSPTLHRFRLYAPLRADPDLFRDLRLEDDGATLVWGDGRIDMPADAIWDLARETMDNAEFRCFLERNGLTLDAAAAALGISRRQVAYFAADKPVPRTVALACRGFESLHRTAA
ncbi:MAG: hypothetical protein RLY86_253 [Pseudomonadota bacterium]|jgi:hypothetical protein